MPNTTDRNQNTRQATQNEAESVRGLARHNQDYWRLPEALKAIVDAYEALDQAESFMDDARTGMGLRPEDAPAEQMIRELGGLVEHTRAELRRHGVIEGALAWLAGHPEGWDDEPDASDQGDDAEQHPWGVKAATTQCRHGHWLIECVECQNDDQGDDPLLHGFPREWFTGD